MLEESYDTRKSMEGLWFTVHGCQGAVCSEKGLLNVQANRKLNQSCEDILAGLPKVLPEDNVQWAEECDERRRVMASSV